MGRPGYIFQPKPTASEIKFLRYSPHAIWPVNDSDQRFVVLDMLYSPTILMAKLSLLALYLHIFRPNPTLRYCIYFGMVFLALFYTSTFTAYGYLSIPRRGQSQLQAILSVNTAKDIPLGIIQGAVNVVSDFCILIIPIPGVLKLQYPWAKTIGVLSIFMTGLL